jgi:hypothetical protein
MTIHPALGATPIVGEGVLLADLAESPGREDAS